MAPAGDDAALGASRFEIRKKLGAGAFGAVFQAFDRERGAVVAVKSLRRFDAAAIYRFKKEFRSLTDLSHRNLVKLFELASVGDQWFFTMEHVDGVDLRTWVRPDDVLDPSRARAALEQLALGVVALHRAGKLHRDIKPSNVLVEPATERVVLLDFGLVTDVAPAARDRTAEKRILGTPSYMSPEQATRGDTSEASDWYSVGVVLYELLTGRLPQAGGADALLMAGPRAVPSPPSAVDATVPEELDDLCMALLSAAPQDRPTGRDVLRRLGVREDVPPIADALFVGRTQELDALRAAFLEAADDAVVVRLHGRSGMGKSSVLAAFLDEIEQRDDALVLSGRCYEQDSVPYKALDTVIDALTRELMRLDEDDAHDLMPRDILALARLFPVLRRVQAVALPRVPRFEPPDPHESRRRAFTALRELIAAFARKRRVVIAIDDLQWGDVDSANLLAEVLRAPHAPRALVVASYRREEVDASAFLRAFLPAHPDAREVAVDPMTTEDAQDMLASLVGISQPDRLRDALIDDARGNPFLLHELALHILHDDSNSIDTSRVSVDDMLRRRIRQLSPAAQRTLCAIAVAARPIPHAIAKRAAELGDDSETTVVELRAARMVRSLGIRQDDLVEAYHDRVRETAVATLSAQELADTHRRLAEALEASDHSDREALAAHFWAAGDAARAARYAILAAKQAADALAFDRAAALYRFAIDAQSPEGRDGSLLRERLANALVNAGRGAEAARAYLSAVDGAYVGEALEYRRLAAEQLMRAGYVDEGMRALEQVLASLGLDMPKPGRLSMLSLMFSRLRLRLRGLDFVPRDPTQIASESLSRIDTLWSVAAALGMVNTVAGVDFQARNVLLALDTGDPMRVARALSMEGIYVSLGGYRTRKRSGRLMGRALELVEGGEDAKTEAQVLGSAAFRHFQLGELDAAYERATRSNKMLRGQCTGVAWELDTSELMIVWVLYYQGRLAELAERLPKFVRAARERGDLFAHTSFNVGVANAHWLCRDEPERARAESDAAIERWSDLGFHLQHYWAWLSRTQHQLYASDAEGALATLRATWPRLQQAMFLRIQAVAIEGWHTRARVELANGLVDDAGKAAKRLEREKLPWSHALAACVRAGMATARDDRRAAVAELDRAATVAEEARLGLFAIAARRRRGELLGGDEGRALTRDADEALTAESVVAPGRLCAMLIPLPGVDA